MLGAEAFGAVLELLFTMAFICSILGLATTGISFTEMMNLCHCCLSFVASCFLRYLLNLQSMRAL